MYKKFKYFKLILLVVLALTIQCISPVVSSAGSVKWNPGHYMLVFKNYQLNHFDTIFGTVFKGAQVRYDWRLLEPTKGNYNFDMIDRDLNYLKSNGKRLVIFLMERSFDSQPFLPDYILNDPIYGGGYEPFAGKSGGVARLWDPDVNARFKALIEALGNRYDGEEYVEAICFPETAIAIDRQNAPEYTNEKWHNVLKGNIAFAKSKFPHTVVYQFANWLATDMSDLAEHCYTEGAGWGGPDIIPGGSIPSYPYFTQYAGQMPLANSVQPASVNGKHGIFTVQELFEMGVDTLKLNHMFWIRSSGDQYLIKFIDDILPYVESQNGRINTAIPENMGSTVLVSQNKPVLASSQNGGFVAASKANDGDISTRWLVQNGTPFPHWWRVDLGETFHLTKVISKWYESSNRWYKYKIQVSDDDINYTTVVDNTGTVEYGDRLDNLDAVGRYVRILVTDASTVYVSSNEFEVYGEPISVTKISQGKPAAADSENGGFVAASKANDGDISTRWLVKNGTAFPHWWRVDLGETCYLTQVVSKWYESSNRWYKYKIEVSNDDINYTTIVDNTATVEYGDRVDNLNAVGRYVRIYITDASTVYVSSNEFEVYGAPIGPLQLTLVH